jgi:MFS family permease
MSEKKSKTLLACAMFTIAALFYFYEFLLRVAPSVMYAELAQEFDIAATQFGILVSAWYWAYAPLQLPVGIWMDKWGPRRLLTFAIVLCALSTVILALTHSFYLACIMRGFIGAGSAFAFISCMKITAIWFSNRLFPLLVGITLTLGTLGGASSSLISQGLDFLPWRVLLLWLGGLGLILGALAWIVIRDENPTKQESVEESPDLSFWHCLKTVALQPQSWLIGIYAFLVTAPTDTFGGSWGAAYLMHGHGLAKAEAASAQAMTFVGMAVGSPILGWLAGHFNYKIPMLCSSLLAAIFLSILIYWPHINFFNASLLFFLFGSTGTYVLAYVVIRHLNEFNYVGTAVGFVNMISMIGSGFLIGFVGWILDLVRGPSTPLYTLADYHLGLMVLPIFYAVSALIVVPLIRGQNA